MSTYKSTTLILLAALILVSSIALYFWSSSTIWEKRYHNLSSRFENISIAVDLLIDYGNDTQIWYNSTYLPIGSNLFNLTYIVSKGDLDYIRGEYGVFIKSIHKVGLDQNEAHRSYAWLWWRYDQNEERWRLGDVAADQYILEDKDILAWIYQDTSKLSP